jgi:hypothetical protein
MKTGLWIDHRRAILVALTDKGEVTRVIESGAESQPRRSGEAPLRGHYETRRVAMEDIHEREFADHLKVYYDEVIGCIRDADSILLFGPGEAKDELQKRLAKNRLGDRVAAVETADKMTARQIEAKVRKYFRPSP